MRGELETVGVRFEPNCGSSPHAWGTGAFPRAVEHHDWFIPTCVGNCLHKTTRNPNPAVHPHMRGELELRGKAKVGNYGSSPHAWGTVSDVVGVSFDIAVHPHMRGELCAAAIASMFRFGSSPHAWGTVCMQFIEKY